MKRKKVRGIAVVCALVSTVLAAGVVAPTLAWLSSNSQTVTNTFKSESITVNIDEAKVDTVTGKKLVGDDAARVAGNEYKVVAGRILDKDPTPSVVGGSVECAVYVKVTNADTTNFTPAYDTGDTGAWELVKGNDAEAIYRYKTTVNAYDVDKQKSVGLKPIFETVTVSEDFTGFAEGVDKVEITVQAYAVQAEGLVNGDDFSKADAQAEDYFNK